MKFRAASGLGSHADERIPVLQVAVQHLRLVAGADFNHLRGGHPVRTGFLKEDRVEQVMHQITVEDFLAEGLAVRDQICQTLGVCAVEFGNQLDFVRRSRRKGVHRPLDFGVEAVDLCLGEEVLDDDAAILLEDLEDLRDGRRGRDGAQSAGGPGHEASPLCRIALTYFVGQMTN